MAANIIPFPRAASNDLGPDAPPPSSPASVLAFTPKPSRGNAFRRAYHEARIASAERELIEARFLAAHGLNEIGAANPFWELREPAFTRMLDAIERVAALPAADIVELRMKKGVIGKVWLKAEGERYDRYRQSVAADAARLARGA